MLTYERIKEELTPTFVKIRNTNKSAYKSSTLVYTENKQLQLINSKLITIFSNQIENPIMTEEKAYNYYFMSNNARNNLLYKYQLIINVKDLIINETLLPFTFEKLIILKILQVTLPTYNKLLTYCNKDDLRVKEELADILLDIETMTLMERNLCAEMGLKNARAVDTVNRYKKEFSGFEVEQKYNDEDKLNRNEIVLSIEENKKIIDNFGFSNLLSKKQQQDKQLQITTNEPKKRGRKKKNE